MPAKLVGRKRLDGLEFYIVDVTPSGVGVEFIYSYIIAGPSRVLVVETGPQSSAESLAEFMETRGLLEGEVVVAVTHIHLDHGGGAGGFARRAAGKAKSVKVYVHPKGHRHLLDPSKLWQASRQALGWVAEVYGEPLPVPSEALEATSDGQAIDIDGARALFIHTPGHASHHQSVLVEAGGERILFTGDSAGMYLPEAEAVTPTTPPPFRYTSYLSSLSKQEALKPTVLAYTHRGLARPEILAKHREQVILWRRTLETLLASKPYVGEEEALNAILEVDPLTKRYVEESGMPALIEILITLSIRGFIEDIKASK